jgi:hypothetical protein
MPGNTGRGGTTKGGCIARSEGAPCEREGADEAEELEPLEEDTEAEEPEEE